MRLFFYQNNFKKPNMIKYFRTMKLLRKLVVSTPIISLAFNGIHAKVNTLKYAYMGQQVCLPFLFSQLDLTTGYCQRKQQQRQATTKKISRKVPEESVEAI